MKPLSCLFDKEALDQIDRYYDCAMFLVGLLVDAKCQNPKCKLYFRLVDFRGSLFDNTIKCPCCLYRLMDKVQNPNEMIECLHCHRYKPKRLFQYYGVKDVSTLDKKTKRDGVQCPECKEPQFKALKEYQKTDEYVSKQKRIATQVCKMLRSFRMSRHLSRQCARTLLDNIHCEKALTLGMNIPLCIRVWVVLCLIHNFTL